MHSNFALENKISLSNFFFFFFLRRGEGSMCFSIGVVVVHRYSRVHPRTIREISSFLAASLALLKISVEKS